MFLSDNDLKSYCNVKGKSKSPEELSRLLTEHVVEVEGMHQWSLDRVVVGVVKSIKPHSNADRLRLVETSIGSKTLTIVCGGTNLYEGEAVAVALEGSWVRWHGQGEKIELKNATIRGVESQGMICTADELDLPIANTTDTTLPQPTILDLTRFELAVKLGTPLAQALALDDVRYEIDNKSLARRADLWGYWGMARELEVLLDWTIKKPELANIVYKKSRIASIKDPKACLRYIAVEIDNVTVTESPWDVQRRLINAGLRPINLIVDLTNLVMIELGQPLHVFDRAHIDHIEIRKARYGEKLQALNGKIYDLIDTDCVIANKRDPIALAGIIGGEHSGVASPTTSIILESATFEPVMIRKTGQRLLVRTDSSARFEKGQAVELAQMGAERFCRYLKKYQPTATIVHAESVGNKKTVLRPIPVRWQQLDAMIGSGVVSGRQAKHILEGLGCRVKGSRMQWSVTPPWWRNDLDIPADLAEEAARIHGFNAMAHRLPTMATEPAMIDPARSLEEDIRTFLVERCSWDETESYPFDTTPLTEGEQRIEVLSPISQDANQLRSDMLPTLLVGACNNFRYVKDVRIFEIGRVYRAGHAGSYPVANGSNQMLPDQPMHCAGVVAGVNNVYSHAKGVIEELGRIYGWQLSFGSLERPEFDPELSRSVWCDGKQVGEMGLINSDTKRAFDLPLDEPLSYVDLNLDVLESCTRNDVVFTPLAHYPPVLRDIALIVPASVTYESVARYLADYGPPLTSFQLFDVYQGERVGAGNRSLAFHLTFSDPTRTLTNHEVDASLKEIVAKLEKGCCAKLVG